MLAAHRGQLTRAAAAATTHLPLAQADMSWVHWHPASSFLASRLEAATSTHPATHISDHDNALGAREGAEAERAASGHPDQTAAGGRQQVLRRLRSQRSVGHTSTWHNNHDIVYDITRSLRVRAVVCVCEDVESLVDVVTAVTMSVCSSSTHDTLFPHFIFSSFISLLHM